MHMHAADGATIVKLQPELPAIDVRDEVHAGSVRACCCGSCCTELHSVQSGTFCQAFFRSLATLGRRAIQLHMKLQK
jgi:hypothetical protein